jgi:hypothetical protein
MNWAAFYRIVDLDLFLKIKKQRSKKHKIYFEGNSHRETYELLNFFLTVLGLELKAFTLSHFTSPIFVKDFSR